MEDPTVWLVLGGVASIPLAAGIALWRDARRHRHERLRAYAELAEEVGADTRPQEPSVRFSLPDGARAHLFETAEPMAGTRLPTTTLELRAPAIEHRIVIAREGPRALERFEIAKTAHDLSEAFAEQGWRGSGLAVFAESEELAAKLMTSELLVPLGRLATLGLTRLEVSTAPGRLRLRRSGSASSVETLRAMLVVARQVQRALVPESPR